jgi:hypothetical protein
MFQVLIAKVLGIDSGDNYMEDIDNMLEAFKAMKVDVCLKMYYLHSLLNFFP